MTTPAQDLDRDGYTILRGALDAAHVAELLADIERLERDLAIVPAGNLFEGSATNRVYNLLARGKSFERAVDHDAILPVVESLLGRGFLASTVSSIAILPGEKAQPIHADDHFLGLSRPHQPMTSTVMIALTPFNDETGGTRVLPASHRNAALPNPFAPHEEATSVVMSPGDALVYNGSVWHGGGANRSTSRRVGLAIGYCVGWMRQQENQQLGISREVAKGFSPRLRKLAGYGLYKQLYGHIDKCSPVDLLDECPPRVVVGAQAPPKRS